MVLKPRKWQSAGSNVSFDKENELDTDAAALVHGDVLEPVAKPELGDVALKPLLIEVPNTPAQCDESVELELKAEAGADLGPVLTIAQFAPCPWVDFGRALVAKPTTATFTVHNPTGAVQTIGARACCRVARACVRYTPSSNPHVRHAHARNPPRPAPSPRAPVARSRGRRVARQGRGD
jgi:hypothetical protein